jgi:uncharacterized protein
MSKDRYVFDTGVIVSGLLFEESVPAQALFAAAERGEILLSVEAAEELAEVLSRPKFDRYLTPQEREELLVAFLEDATVVFVDQSIQACRDPEDDKFLELAVCGQAACVVSGDKDLLILHPFRGIPILAPAAFLASLEEL